MTGYDIFTEDMQDIKIPDPHDRNLREKAPKRESDFEISKVEHEREESVVEEVSEPSERVKVRFDKFVQLVATHNFEEVMKKHSKEDLILSTNLLTDLANAHEEEPREGKKLPIIFIVGVVIGVVITYLLIRF